MLRRVAMRLQLATIGRTFYAAFLLASAVFAAGLVTSRLAGIMLGWFNLWSLAAVPAAAMLATLILHRRPTAVDAARVVDRTTATKDLFLTIALLENSAGEYQPLVAKAAEERAARVRPVEVVPYRCRNQLATLTAVLAFILAVVFVLPQFDPFGTVAAAQKVVQKREQLEETKKATQQRAAMIKSETEEGEVSEETRRAIEGLKNSLNRMKPKQKSDNQKELAGQQKHIGDMWRKLNSEKLKELLSHSPEEQQLGNVDREKLEKWTRELQEGSSKALQSEINEIIEDLQRLAKTDDPVKKAELEQKIRKRMRDLKSFANDKVNSKPLSAALERAMQQLEMSRMEGLEPKEAAEAAQKSLELTKLELKEIAQSATDLKKLEEALKLLQMARQLNDQEKLDGEETEGMSDLADYEAFYEQLMAELGLTGGEGEGEGDDGDGEGEGDGDGLGGRGMGRGGKAPEDDSIETDFRAEQSRSPVTAGKVLMSLKTKGLSDRGDARKEYRNAIEKVKQGVNEAIQQEQIPPGYVEGIQKYFNNLEKSQPAGKAAPADEPPADDGED